MPHPPLPNGFQGLSCPPSPPPPGPQSNVLNRTAEPVPPQAASPTPGVCRAERSAPLKPPLRGHWALPSLARHRHGQQEASLRPWSSVRPCSPGLLQQEQTQASQATGARGSQGATGLTTLLGATEAEGLSAGHHVGVIPEEGTGTTSPGPSPPEGTAWTPVLGAARGRPGSAKEGSGRPAAGSPPAVRLQGPQEPRRLQSTAPRSRHASGFGRQQGRESQWAERPR